MAIYRLKKEILWKKETKDKNGCIQIKEGKFVKKKEKKWLYLYERTKCYEKRKKGQKWQYIHDRKEFCARRGKKAKWLFIDERRKFVKE